MLNDLIILIVAQLYQQPQLIKPRTKKLKNLKHVGKRNHFMNKFDFIKIYTSKLIYHGTSYH